MVPTGRADKLLEDNVDRDGPDPGRKELTAKLDHQHVEDSKVIRALTKEVVRGKLSAHRRGIQDSSDDCSCQAHHDEAGNCRPPFTAPGLSPACPEGRFGPLAPVNHQGQGIEKTDAQDDHHRVKGQEDSEQQGTSRQVVQDKLGDLHLRKQRGPKDQVSEGNHQDKITQ